MTHFRFADTTGLKVDAREVALTLFWFVAGSSPALAFFAFQVWG
jgi:hypothetical protein